MLYRFQTFSDTIRKLFAWSDVTLTRDFPSLVILLDNLQGGMFLFQKPIRESQIVSGLNPDCLLKFVKFHFRETLFFLFFIRQQQDAFTLKPCVKYFRRILWLQNSHCSAGILKKKIFAQTGDCKHSQLYYGCSKVNRALSCNRSVCLISTNR